MRRDKDFAATLEFMENIKDDPMQVFYHQQLIDYIKDIDLSGRVLDIGERNPLTERMEKYFNIRIDSTSGDLDETFIPDRFEYDVVILSQVIEHLFNPLLCLENIGRVMHKDSILVIGTPIKPGFITTNFRHFHEMDKYQFGKLIRRAGLEIINWQRNYAYHNINWKSFTGIRPFLKMFYRRTSYVKCIKLNSCNGQIFSPRI